MYSFFDLHLQISCALRLTSLSIYKAYAAQAGAEAGQLNHQPVKGVSLDGADLALKQGMAEIRRLGADQVEGLLTDQQPINLKEDYTMACEEMSSLLNRTWTMLSSN